MATNIKKILCPVDLSEHSDDLVEKAAYFARQCNAELSVVYVKIVSEQTKIKRALIAAGVDLPPDVIDRMSRSTTADPFFQVFERSFEMFSRQEDESASLDEIVSSAQASIDYLVAQYCHDIKANGEVIVDSGYLYEIILAKVVKENADLVIMGGTLRNDDYVISKTTREVVKKSPVPVLLDPHVADSD